ncbi:hypothetical protein [Corallococcus sp. AB038B]|uniref:hypothetical protein n=1 Tax=Corallococcus sp. AB038B TaxID=2316718 RepID=UPI000EDFF095|nr:hypothetical protein [Corallococcus sp. AB038B]RKH93585.1 hypothetical protein D7Y04_39970 [Corallococcus sp. AB038B]
MLDALIGWLKVNWQWLVLAYYLWKCSGTLWLIYVDLDKARGDLRDIKEKVDEVAHNVDEYVGRGRYNGPPDYFADEAERKRREGTAGD